MSRLIEVSIRGSRYYLLADIDERKMAELKKLASQFYSQNLWCNEANDYEIAAGFISAMKTDFNMHMELIRVDLVLTIK